MELGYSSMNPEQVEGTVALINGFMHTIQLTIIHVVPVTNFITVTKLV